MQCWKCMAFLCVVVSPVESSATQNECDIYTPVCMNQLGREQQKEKFALWRTRAEPGSTKNNRHDCLHRTPRSRLFDKSTQP